MTDEDHYNRGWADGRRAATKSAVDTSDAVAALNGLIAAFKDQALEIELLRAEVDIQKTNQTEKMREKRADEMVRDEYVKSLCAALAAANAEIADLRAKLERANCPVWERPS